MAGRPCTPAPRLCASAREPIPRGWPRFLNRGNEVPRGGLLAFVPVSVSLLYSTASLFLALVFFGPKTAWGWLGLIPLVTGLTGTCLLYKPFGMKTCKTRKA